MAAIPCVVCDHPALDTINSWLNDGMSAREIEDRVRIDKRWANIKRETIGRHASHLRKMTPEDVAVAATRAVAKGSLPRVNHDFALAVRDEALALLERGDIEIDAKAGLFAQSLIDKRVERDKDRDFMLNLARLISGAGQGAPLKIIDDAEYEVLDPEPSLLAPPSVRE